MKDSYLRKAKEQKRVRTGDKFRQVFREDWDAKEDTSVDINPLYRNRKDASLMFGRGHLGGVETENSFGKLDTVTRNFMQQKTFLNKSVEDMTERDWRIFREDNEIIVKGGHCPNPIRSWKEIEGDLSH